LKCIVLSDRNKQIFKASLISIVGNAILAVLKIVVGIISGSLAVIADGIDSSGDIISSIITLYTSRLLKKAPSAKYPYGYDKADTIAAKALSFIMLFAGAQLAISTVSKIINNEISEIPTILAIVVTALSIAGKAGLSKYLSFVGKKTKSYMLRANAKNMQTDILVSVSVLAGLFFTLFLKLPVLDYIMALLVSVWILKVGFQIFIETSINLMDGNKDITIYNQIFEIIDNIPNVYNPHRVRARKIGERTMIAVDLEVDGSMTLKEAHALAHQVEGTLKDEIEDVFDVAIHVEPLGDVTSEKELGLSRESIDFENGKE